MTLVPDFESKLLIDIAPKLATLPEEFDKLQVYVRNRAEMVRRGVLRCPSWFQEELNQLDSRLRCWWDSWQDKWIIDRLQDEGIAEKLRRMSEDGKIDAYGESTGLLASGPYYLTIMQFTPTPDFPLDRQVIELLRRSDMQRFDAAEHLKNKREAAEKQQKENDRVATEKVLGVVDQMGAKQMEQFIAVEEAIQNGETITAHGSDLAFLERANADKQRALKEAEERGETPVFDNPIGARNPGMDPRIYKRRGKVTV